MIEIPESHTLAAQMQQVLTGKTVRRVHTASSSHKFCFFNGDPALYGSLLSGRTVIGASGHGMFADILFDGAVLSVNDGVNPRWLPGAFSNGTANLNDAITAKKVPAKFQLLIEFTGGDALVFTVAMYGAIWAFTDTCDNPYYQGSLRAVSPLSDVFDAGYFAALLDSCKKDLSAKALLAAEQRIPGLGNGCVQDILFTCGVHPKRKMSMLSSRKKDELFDALKSTLADMTAKGGRDTEKNLYGNPGGYKTLLSKFTYKNPCPRCGGAIVKEAYLGGSVYYCPVCQNSN